MIDTGIDRILAADEVVYLICENLGQPSDDQLVWLKDWTEILGRENQASLAALARTCQAFSRTSNSCVLWKRLTRRLSIGPALRMLWQNINGRQGLKRFLELMPEDLWSGSIPSGTNSWTDEYVTFDDIVCIDICSCILVIGFIF
jgi:hypothetical protein